MRLLCDAIAFCYGPATVLKRVLEVNRDLFDSIDLIGDGTTVEYMSRTHLIDRVIQANTLDENETEHLSEGHWDVLFSVCNPVGFNVLRRKANYSIYWDFLLWMRSNDALSAEFTADTYVAEMYPGTEEVIDRMDGKIGNILRCPVLAEWDSAPDPLDSDYVVMNLGGQRSHLTTPGVNTQYPYFVVECMQEAASRVRNKLKYFVACDAETTNELRRRYGRMGWYFESFEHENYLSLLKGARSLLTHPGLYSPFEGIGAGRPTLFLPSSNYTQYLQIRRFSEEGIAPLNMEWNRYLDTYVEEVDDEVEGVRQVLEVVNRGTGDRDVAYELTNTAWNWLSVDSCFLERVVASQRRRAKRFFGNFETTIRSLFESVIKDRNV